MAGALLIHPRLFSGLEKFALVGAWSKKISPTAESLRTAAVATGFVKATEDWMKLKFA
jgi:hypothetical protein